MTVLGVEICDYSDLREDQCHHCDPNERATKPKTEDEIWLDGIREQVNRALIEKSTTTMFPLPIVRTEKRATTSTPKWNPGNVAAQIGGHLRAIEDMFDALSEEAENRHGDREFPGGDAMVMLGPGADVEAFNYRQLSAFVGRVDEKDVVIAQARDLEPPLAFLASWEDIIREERDQPVYLRATIKRSAKYIRDSIAWMLSDDEFGNMNFIAIDDLAEQLGNVRRQVEDILKDGSRAEFTRINCTHEDCDAKPRLMKLWASQVRWDRYRCPHCKTEYDKAQFELAKSEHMHSQGLERFLTPRDAADATEVPIKTVYSWMKRRKAERVWVTPVDGLSVAHVWWPDVRDLSLERTARLKRIAKRRAERKAEKEAEEKAEARKAEAEARAKDVDTLATAS